MGIGIRPWLCQARVNWNLLRANVRLTLFGIEDVAVLLKFLDKDSGQEILRRFGARIGKDCDIESGLIIHNACDSFGNLVVGDCCHIGKGGFVDLRDRVYIRERVTISMRVSIITHLDTGYAGPFSDKYANHTKPVVIGPGAYIGACATILPGVHVGEGSIVGAVALVDRDVPPRTVVAGVPARVIRDLNLGNESI